MLNKDSIQISLHLFLQPYGAVQKELNKIKDKSQKLNREAVPESDDCDGSEVDYHHVIYHNQLILNFYRTGYYYL